jgi:hypothetical protein
MTGHGEIEFHSNSLTPAEIHELARHLVPAIAQGRPGLTQAEREVLASEYAHKISLALGTPGVDIGFFKAEGRGIRLNLIHAVEVLAEQISTNEVR